MPTRSSGTIHKLTWALLILGSTPALGPHVQLVQAALVNSTVEDSLPDPRTGDRIVYTPDGAWRGGDANCAQCFAHPSEQSVSRGTWYEGLSGGTNGSLIASMAFTGTAIYVYCVVPHSSTLPNPASTIDLSFSIDNQPVGTFSKTPPAGVGYDYDVLVFSAQSLTNKRHHFFVSSGKPDGPSSIVILDRIVYSYDDGTKASNGAKTAGIVVGTLAGVAAICIAASIWYFRRFRRRRGQMSGSDSKSRSRTVIDPDVDGEGQSIQYPTVVPFRSLPNTNTSPGHALPSPTSPTASSPLTGSSGRHTKSRAQSPRPQQRPSQASFHIPYSANEVDI